MYNPRSAILSLLTFVVFPAMKDRLLHYLCHRGQTRVLLDQWPSFGCDEVTAKKHEATRPLIIYDGKGKENEKLTLHQGDNTFRAPAEYLPTTDTNLDNHPRSLLHL